MPRDEWARANARAKYGSTDQKLRRIASRDGEAAARDYARDAGRTLAAGRKIAREPASVAARWSGESKLWFGKHKDVRIADIPRDYLVWLLESHVPGKWWRMDGLALFLRAYLSRQQAVAVLT